MTFWGTVAIRAEKWSGMRTRKLAAPTIRACPSLSIPAGRRRGIRAVSDSVGRVYSGPKA